MIWRINTVRKIHGFWCQYLFQQKLEKYTSTVWFATSLVIIWILLEIPFKPISTILLWCLRGFRGPLFETVNSERRSSVSDCSTPDWCIHSSPAFSGIKSIEIIWKHLSVINQLIGRHRRHSKAKFENKPYNAQDSFI